MGSKEDGELFLPGSFTRFELEDPWSEVHLVYLLDSEGDPPVLGWFSQHLEDFTVNL